VPRAALIRTDTSATVVTLGDYNHVNQGGGSQDYIAYCFHSVSGYSKIGSYTGSGYLMTLFYTLIQVALNRLHLVDLHLLILVLL